MTVAQKQYAARMIYQGIPEREAMDRIEQLIDEARDQEALAKAAAAHGLTFDPASITPEEQRITLAYLDTLRI